MTIDLSNPDHEAALVDACAISRSATSIKVIAANPSILDTRPLVAKALEALSSPTSAAVLIRQLVERNGATLDVCGPSGIGSVIYCCLPTGHSGGCRRLWRDANVAAVLIDRLLALAPKAGAEAVLRALRGESKP